MNIKRIFQKKYKPWDMGVENNEFKRFKGDVVELAKMLAKEDKPAEQLTKFVARHIVSHSFSEEQVNSLVSSVKSVDEKTHVTEALSAVFHSGKVDETTSEYLQNVEEAKRLAGKGDVSGSIEAIKSYEINDESIRIEIAKIAVAQDGLGTSKYIQKFGITDQKALVEIAKIVAAQDNWGTSLYIQNYGIEDQKALVEIAKISAAQSSFRTSFYIKNYGIEDQKALAEIAKISAAQDGLKTSQHIQKYGITDQKTLAEIAKIAAAQDGGGTSEHIRNYGITDQKALAKIAKIAAAQKGLRIFEYLEKYGITDQKALAGIAKIVAAQDGGGTSEHIQKYGIEDQKALVEVAKIAAAQDGGGTSEHIQNYGITDQKALVEVAMIAAVQRGSRIFEYLEKYDITDQEAIVEVAKIAAAHDGGGTSEHIQKYGIEDPVTLVEVAKIAAAQDGWGTSQHIKNYGIEDPVALAEIAKKAASQSGWGTSEHIQKYGITDPKALVEIAKKAAIQDGGGTSLYIKNYGITDPLAFVEIAKKAAAQDGGGTSKYIKNYGIEDKTVLAEIAKIAAAQNGWETSKHIQNYGIEDKTVLVEIAKKAAAQNGGGTSLYIKNYGIEDPTALAEIAKKAAAQNGELTSWNIKNYGIEDPLALVEIAKIAAVQDGGGTSKHIRNYGIEDKTVLAEIAKKAATQDGGRTSEYIQNYGITDQKALLEIFIISFSNNTKSAQHFSGYFPGKDLADYVPEGTPKHLQDSLGIMYFTFNLLKIVGGETFKEQLGDLRNPQARNQALLFMVQNRDAMNGLKLPVDVALQSLKSQGVNCAFNKRLRRENMAQQQMILTAADLLNRGDMTPEEMQRLMDVAIVKSSSETIKRLQIISTVIRLGRTELLVREPIDLEGNLQTAFMDLFELEGIDDFSTKYFQTINKFRDPLAVSIYLGALLKLPEPDKSRVVEDLRTYVREVLKGEFTTMRYKGSKHLDLLLDDKTKALWTKGADKRVSMTSSGDVEEWFSEAPASDPALVHYQLVDTDDPCDLLLMGKGVAGSCLNVGGDGQKNKGLLGIMLDGKNRLLLLKNSETEKIVGRSLIRILSRDGKPALFIEQIYPIKLEENEQKVLVKFAKERAKALGMPLYTKEHGGEPSPGTLKSISGRGSYENVDSARGNQPIGKYEISGLRLLWKPKAVDK